MKAGDMVKIEIFIPEANLAELAEALHQAGAGRIGRYDHCLSIMPVKGTWRPLEGAEPYLGKVGELCTGEELKVEVNCPQENVKAALQAVRRVHPYDEPVINVLQLLEVD
ncbi:MAG TPA: hypothetical protein VN376_05655 [Longilinea sp.]|nr:hypothetical protein [Longilinea sp.]